jgi:thioredoxin reductase
VLEGPLPGGQLTTTSEVENFPGFPHGVDGFQLTQNMREQATRFGTRFEQAMVTAVDFTAMPRKLISATAPFSPRPSSSPPAPRRASPASPVKRNSTAARA